MQDSEFIEAASQATRERMSNKKRYQVSAADEFNGKCLEWKT